MQMWLRGAIPKLLGLEAVNALVSQSGGVEQVVCPALFLFGGSAPLRVYHDASLRRTGLPDPRKCHSLW